MAGPDTRQPSVIVAGAARSGTSGVAAAVAAAMEAGSVVEGSSILGLASTLSEARKRFLQERSEAQPVVADADAPPPEPAVGLVDGLCAAPGTTVIRAADALRRAPCLRALPLVAARCPGAGFVVVVRDGVDFVASRRRALPTVEFVTHCLVWAEWQAVWREIAPTLGRAAIVVDRGLLLADPAAIAQSLGEHLAWSAEARARFVSHAQANRPGKTTLAGKPLDIASVGWTVAEKMLFAEICGPAVRASGKTLDIDGALRRRPLRLDEAIGNGGAHFAGGDGGEIRVTGSRGGFDVVWPGTSAKGIMVLPALAPSGRRKLKISAGLLGGKGGAGTNLRVDVVESLHRRSLARGERRIDAERLDIAATVEPTLDLVDVVFTAEADGGGSPFGFRLFEASLAR